MFAMVPDQVLFVLTPAELRVWCALAREYRPESNGLDVWPTQESMAELLGCKLSTLRDHLRALESKGVVHKVRTRRGNRYVLDALGSSVPAEPAVTAEPVVTDEPAVSGGPAPVEPVPAEPSPQPPGDPSVRLPGEPAMQIEDQRETTKKPDPPQPPLAGGLPNGLTPDTLLEAELEPGVTFADHARDRWPSLDGNGERPSVRAVIASALADERGLRRSGGANVEAYLEKRLDRAHRQHRDAYRREMTAAPDDPELTPDERERVRARVNAERQRAEERRQAFEAKATAKLEAEAAAKRARRLREGGLDTSALAQVLDEISSGGAA